MNYILYLSTACQVFYVEEMEAMLIKIRSNNKKFGVTGVLLYSGRSFLQFIEGEQEILNQMMQKIGKDSRHYNIVKLASGTSEERLFADWNMAFKVSTDDEIKQLEGFIDPSKPDFYATLQGEKPHPVVSILKSFAENNRMH